MERLKAFNVEKFTLDGRKFHTLTILSPKYLLVNVWNFLPSIRRKLKS